MVTRPNLRRIMTKAWLTAKLRARRNGTQARAELPLAMQQAWAEEKALVTRCNDMARRMIAETARIIVEIRTPRIAHQAPPGHFRLAA